MAAESTGLKDFLHKIAEEKGYDNGQIDIKDISSGGANYTSTLHIATISALGKENLKLFAKYANICPTLRATDETFAKVYETERIFYSELAVAFQWLYDKHGVAEEDRMHLSKYYGYQSTENNEILILEDLSASGFGSFDRFKTFDWDYAEAAVNELAKFHALGIAAKEENLEEFQKIKDLGMDLFSLNMKDVLVQHAYKIGTEMVKEEYRSRLQKFFNKRDLQDDFAIIWKTSNDGFLIHSDYRPNNLMHREHNGKLEVVALDFQTLHFGSLVADLLYLIWLGSDSKFRQNHYQQLLDLYYNELTIALRNLNININGVYPRKTFEQELDDSKTLGLVLGLAMMPILSVYPEDVPKNIETSESMAIKPNPLALEKINDIISDYVKSGII